MQAEYAIDTCSELPPRARRIHRKSLSVRMGIGTTSACAENTQGLTHDIAEEWNYLRVRGEYHASKISSSSSKELPPRARRIQGFHAQAYQYQGTTSACAENTILLLSLVRLPWNYLRVRGEYPDTIVMHPSVWELPPRARRIRGARDVS